MTPLLAKAGTPFYLISIVPVEGALRELDGRFGHLPVRHWLSFKTQPLRPLVQWWQRTGRDVEVVSEFELRAALAEGFAPERILVNGPAKHHWLPRHSLRNLRVNFDSAAEARALASQAKILEWSTGVRVHTREEHDSEYPDCPTQFGLVRDEAIKLLKWLRRAKVRVETVHFHLRTNVATAARYEIALKEVGELCRAAKFSPLHVDCGGGFPPPNVATRGGKFLDRDFNFIELARIYQRALAQFPGAREIWLENGRWLTARSGALVVKILEAKQRHGPRHLICDGGRTTTALVSTWERHGLLAIPERRGLKCLTVVNGPTCMAFDQLAREPLPARLRPGDHLVWLEAGAYHLPWETRFSHGLAPVYWHDGKETRLVRERENFENWWGQWIGA
ncbi:MAG TPA: hypothetical protein VHH73_08460 [Verrucomicrobiae bacterium]|nr:hypothetical protein [Verrucomicrobiae bacterium]